MASNLEQIFIKSYKENADALFRFCFLKVSDRELAKDLLQDVFLRAGQYLQKGNSVDNMKSFLFSVARNAVIDEYRKKKSTTSTSLDALFEEGFDFAAGATGFAGGASGASGGMNGGDMISALDSVRDGERAMKFLATLPKKYREAIHLQYVEGLSLGEISEITGESSNNISVRIHRGLEKLREILKNDHE